MTSASDIHVALLRGVNVGGGNKVPMADLRAIATDLGWQSPRTYIASGNVVFTASGASHDLAARLRGALAARLGVDVAVMVLSRSTLISALATCPWVVDEGRQVHGFWCEETPEIDTARASDLIARTERLEPRGNMVWLYAPDGIGRSALAAKIGSVIRGTDFTARNLNTWRTLAAMVAGDA